MAEPIDETISAWMPETDRIRLAVLGKLIEECNELCARAARCIIQGIHEVDPATGRTNRVELAREAADVTACIEMLRNRLDHRIYPSSDRVLEKLAGYRRWHQMIEDANDAAIAALAESYLGAP